MNTITIGHRHLPVLGMGTWGLGEGDAHKNDRAIETLRSGLDHGLTVIDTAEMYGDGAAETLVGAALRGYQRQSVYLISKFYPWHATPAALRKSLTQSLRRLKTDYLDLYLLHWPGQTPVAETLAGLQAVQKEGLIRAYGVSNFDAGQLAAAQALPGGNEIVANEVLYNVQARGIEFDLLPAHQETGVATIGYSPFGSGDGRQIPIPPTVAALAAAKSLSVHQLLLAWTLRTNRVLTIPKAASPAHLLANLQAADVTWTAAELAVIDAAFPPPTQPVPLQMI